MPYKADTAPDWVKKLPAEAKDAWIKAYNAAYKQYKGDEAKSNATASATIKKMGYHKKGEKWVKSKEVAIKEALVELSVFGAGVDPEVMAVDEERVDVAANGKLYHLPYTEKGGAYVFGQAQEVEPAEKPEPFEAAKESERIELQVAEDDQHKANPEAGDWPVVIIEEGCNSKKRRKYTGRALESADANLYRNVPMHIDHAGAEGQHVARGLRDMHAIVKEAWHAVSEGGKQQLRAMVHLFPGWFKTMFEDADFRKSIGLSHVADIAGRTEGRGREAMQVVESIVQPYAVDFVSKAAFGGRVLEGDDPISKRNEDLMALETLTVDDLKRDRPDLVEFIQEAAKASFRVQESESEAVAAAQQEAAAAKERAEAAEAALRKTKVERLAVEEVAKPDHKIPEAMRPVVAQRVAAKPDVLGVEDAKLGDAVSAAVKAEAEFGAGFAPKPKVKAGAGTTVLTEDTRSDLAKTADALIGVKEEKQD